MAIEINELAAKINFVRASRLLKGREWTDAHFTLPTNKEEEVAQVKGMLKAYVKKRFVGCKLRENSLSFSVRLDGELHKKVKKVRDIMMNDDHWKRWFQEHHRRLYDEIYRHNAPFNGDGVETKDRDGQDYLYIPIQLHKINQYPQEGLTRMFTFLDAGYAREAQIAARYEEVIRLMEEERARKAEERRRRIQQDHDRYLTQVKGNLLKNVGTIQANPQTLEERVAVRMQAWCEAQGIAPVKAAEPTYANVVPVGVNIEMIAPTGTDDAGWIAVPTFGQYTMPEGYALIEGYGEVTAHDAENPRARGGVAPLVVQKYIYLEYRSEFWAPYFPERYNEILEATRRATAEAQIEVDAAEAQRQEMLRQQEAENTARAAEERQQATQAAIADQQAKEGVEAEKKAANDALTASLKAQLQAQQTAEVTVDPKTFPDGIYQNDRAIPFEKFVVVHAGRIRRFQHTANANAFASGLGLRGDTLHQVRDYHDIQRVIAEI